MSSLLNRPFESIYLKVWDVVVFGAGYAGWGAARALHERGRAVLLVDRGPGLLWESGWAFARRAGDSSHPIWKSWMQLLHSRSAAAGNHIDGAIAEVLATEQWIGGGAAVLYYAAPVGARRDAAGCIESVAVGVKGAVRQLRARQWIDATEEATLGRIVGLDSGGDTAPRAPIALRAALYFRAAEFSTPGKQRAIDSAAGMKLTLEPTIWPNERRLEIELPGDCRRPRAAWPAAIGAAREACADELDGTVITHASLVPLPIYSPGAGGVCAVENLALACPGLVAEGTVTLAQRFELGIRAAEALEGMKSANPPARISDAIDPAALKSDPRSADVVVAGLGTGGAIAALAAARQGAEVLGIEPLAYPGGIGAGGGIHWYYYGVKGGLQQEVDDRIRAISPLFGASSQVRGFHPDARKLVIEQMLDEAGVKIVYGATLFSAETHRGRVTSARATSLEGPLAISSGAWIDATGDGDLAAMAGADFLLGRTWDGQLHAYSQSSGRADVHEGTVRMNVVNYDAGFVDPTDEQDLTRARLLGVSHYAQKIYDSIERPTYIAPALGLRQGRQVRTDYLLSLPDLIERRRFDDAVGYTGCHYDNHAVDYELESDEAMFWVWCCRQWRGRTASEIPYRMLLPSGLENVWIACRAAGVTEEAHHSFRMQRDLQRIGEVAGIAAALAWHGGEPASRTIPLPDLQKALRASGALAVPDSTPADDFGPRTGDDSFSDPQKSIDEAIAEMRESAGAGMWRLYRARAEAQTPVGEMLRDADADVSWRAACVMAMWCQASAEDRLIHAIERHESGFDKVIEKLRPENNNRSAPNWLIAAALLRRCGSAKCLKALYDLSGDSTLPLNSRTAIAVTCQVLSQRLKLSDAEKQTIARTLHRLLSSPPSNAVRGIQQAILRTGSPQQGDSPTSRPTPVEDATWQLQLTVARALEAAGEKPQDGIEGFLVDPRATVRRAFAAILQKY